MEMMIKMMVFICLHFIYLNFASFLTAYLSATVCFSTLPLKTRVQRFNACKDCLVCIVGVIAGGHYDQKRSYFNTVCFFLIIHYT